ncbi:hypothetical protein D3C72_2417770 [compost metagenome]
MRASIESTGSESAMLNHVNSHSFRPLKRALTGDPVRISPGRIVVTVMPCWASSVRMPSEKPLRANLEAS